MERFPEEIYVLREGQFEGLYAVLMLNHSLKKYPYKKEYPWNLKITVDIVDQNEQGLPTQSEADILNNFEDQIVNLLLGVCEFHFIGRTTWNGLRTLMFYLDSPEKAHEALQVLIERIEVMKANNSDAMREFEYEIREDKEWGKVNYYFDYDNI